MRQLLLLVLAVTLLSGSRNGSATAEMMAVGWHSQYGTTGAVATNATDGSCWAGSGTGVIHVSADGVLLSETRGLPYVHSLSVDSQDGSCWLVQRLLRQVVKLDRDGHELFRVTDLNNPQWVSVNSADGSCWVADTIDSTASRIVHLASDGTRIGEVDGVSSASEVSVNQRDGSIWVPELHAQQVLHLSAQGVELSRTFGFRQPLSVSVNSTDGSCWVADATNFIEGAKWEVAQIAADGTIVRTVAGFFGPLSISANPATGGCWVVCQYGLTRVSPEGEIVSRAFDGNPVRVAASPFDDTAWGAETSSGSVHLAHYAKFGMLFPQIDLGGVASAVAGSNDLSVWAGVLGDWDEAQGRYVGTLVERISADGQVLASSADIQNPSAIGFDRKDDSCWVADAATGEIVHLSVSGEELARVGGFDTPASISVDSDDHSVWVADTGNNEVAHLDASGALLSRNAGFAAPAAVSASSGHCWVADTGHDQIVELRSTGQYSRLDGFSQPRGIARGDDVIWVSDTGHQQVVATYSGGAAWRGGSFTEPTTIFEGPHPGNSCGYLWVLDQGAGQVVALSTTDPSQVTELWRGSVPQPTAMGVSPDDGSVWVASADRRIHHFASDGCRIWRGTSFSDLGGLSVFGSDGSCWITDRSQNRLCRVAPDGTWLVDRTYPRDVLPLNVLVDQRDGSAWVVFQTEKIEHVSSTGETLATWTGFGRPFGIQYNPHDNSFWVSDGGGTGEIIHLAPDGTVLSRTAGLYGHISVNPSDDSCWVADPVHDVVVHLAAGGSEILRLSGFSDPESVAVDATDGSIWLAESPNTPDEGTPRVSHLSATGTSLWSSTDFAEPMALALDPRDRSVWVTHDYDVGTRRSGSLTHIAVDGRQLSRTDGFGSPIWLSVNPVDGSVWFADVGAAEVVHLVKVFSDVDSGSWAADAITACVAANIVSGYDDGLYHPDWPVTRDQMAVYIARGQGWVSIGDPMDTAPELFPDVPAGFWAGTAIQACVDNNVVAGYPYPDPDNPGETFYLYVPSETVTRDQMAVYIARAMVAPTGEAALADYVPADPRNFPDVPNTGYGDSGTDPYWAYTHIEYCVEHGVVNGYEYPDPDTPGETICLYEPLWPVTRDQMAVFIARAFGLAP